MQGHLSLKVLALERVHMNVPRVHMEVHMGKLI